MRISHYRAVEHLPALASGSLRGDAREEIEAHVRECLSCREWMETYAVLSDGLGEIETQHVESLHLALCAVRPQELHEPGMAAVRSHLSECAACRRELSLVEAGLGAARRVGEPAAVAFPPRAILRRRRLLMAAGIAVAILGAAILWREAVEEHRGTVGGRPAPVDALAGTTTTVSHTSLEGSRVFETEGRLEVTRVAIADGADITFRAGERVVLRDGFRVGPKAKLAVEVAGSADRETVPEHEARIE